MIRGQPFLGPAPGQPANALRVAAGCRAEQQFRILEAADRGLGALAVLRRNGDLQEAVRAGDCVEGLAPEDGFRGSSGHGGEGRIAVRLSRGNRGQPRERLGANRLEVGPARHFGDAAQRGKQPERPPRLVLVPVVGGDLDQERLAPGPRQAAGGLVAGAFGQLKQNPGCFETAYRLLADAGIGIGAREIREGAGVLGRVFWTALRRTATSRLLIGDAKRSRTDI